MNQNRLLLIQIQALPPSMQGHKWKEIIDIACKTTQGMKHQGKVIEWYDEVLVQSR